MSINVTVQKRIISWLKSGQHWLRFSGNSILDNVPLSPNFLNRAYVFFLEDNDLKPILASRETILFVGETEDESDPDHNLKLVQIKSLQNVNALAENQVIEVNPNLTIIYGENGAGKSGYIRLINKAFKSRGDATILPNVFSGKVSGDPKAVFAFQSNSGPYELLFPDHAQKHEFSTFSVFDTECVRVHLEEENTLLFTPHGFEFFDNIIIVFDSVREQVKKEIERRKIRNDFSILFKNENAIKDTINNLGSNSDFKLIQDLGAFQKEDQDELDSLIVKRAGLAQLSIPKKISEFKSLQSSLSGLISNYHAVESHLNEERIKIYNDLVLRFNRYHELSRQEGQANLERFQIPFLGSEKWKLFLHASHSYFKSFPEPLEKSEEHRIEKCLFCLQALGKTEIELVEIYWKYLKNESESEANRIGREIRDEEKKIRSLSQIVFDESTNLYSFILNTNPILASEWKNNFSEIDQYKHLVLKNLSEKLESDFKRFDLSNPLNEILKALDTTISDLEKKDPRKEMEELEKAIDYLSDKLLLNKILDQVQEFIDSHKWAAKAERSLANLKTNSLTALQGEMFTAHITDLYTATFNEECENLGAPKVVTIEQRNAKGQTFRRLQVLGKKASQVLSEGEQKAISLADFLTEVKLDARKSGVFFDDPVTSLDHLRKSKIADRIVNLSGTKQVVVFTHDLLFVYYLKDRADKVGSPYQCHWMENRTGIPGVVFNNNSPATENDFKSTASAEVALKKSVDASPQEKERLLKEGFGALRTNYEYFIMYELFQAVVLRFNERVSIERLKSVVVEPNFSAKIIEKSGLLSRYIEGHLHSDSYLAVKPTPEDLKREIAEFQGLKAELKVRRQSVIAAGG